MDQINFSPDGSRVPSDTLKELQEKLQPEIARISAAWPQTEGGTYKTDYASLSLPSDSSLHAEIMEVVKEKQALQPTSMVVVGIGGSNLGTMAIYQALGANSSMNVYFAGTVDADYISTIYRSVETELKSGKNILVVVISKSGTTTETIANAELFIELLQQYKQKEYHQYLVAITDQDSKLWDIAQKHSITSLAIPKLVGGRFSVFSVVGLFPLGMLGVDIKKLAAGAQSMRDACTNQALEKNPAALSAAFLLYHYKKGSNISDTFLFSVALRGVGAWYRQLMGESIGKEHDREGNKINVGITPTVSIGTVDLHSVAQLYLGGPYDKTTTFITVKKIAHTLTVPKESILSSLAPDIANKSFATIMDAIFLGVQTAYKKNKRPFVSIELPEISAYYIGQLLQLKMVEIMYLGYLFNINPFDQPNVELYKKETREILRS